MNLKECSEKICELLINSSYHDEAREIESLVNIILTSEKESDRNSIAIENLIQRCHPKWLGDYLVNGITYNEWTNLITKFKVKLINIK